MWENFVFLVIFDTYDVVYNWFIVSVANLLHMNFILKKATFPKQFNLFYIFYSIQTFFQSLLLELLNTAIFLLTIQK